MVTPEQQIPQGEPSAETHIRLGEIQPHPALFELLGKGLIRRTDLFSGRRVPMHAMLYIYLILKNKKKN